MKRRTFLKATVATAGAAFFGVGCGDDGSNGGPDEPERLDGAAYFTLSVASGDPKPTSVILWTRVADDATTGDLPVSLELALDEAFEQRVLIDASEALDLVARADADGCVKVRMTGLDPATTYFYRFVYRAADAHYVSRVGRTRTAPEDNADVTARFAFVSCQDINGRYYNCHRRLAREELDFFVHLGDYVYETTGDPSFQDSAPGRETTFTDVDGAIKIEEDGEIFYSAASLSNYRELYRTYRADPDLQRLHERYPMVAIWDDHEFSDDAHGVTSTIHAGREDEATPERRQNANQAWFEYMPVDYADPAFDYDPTVAPPNDIQIYRDLRWGRNLHLVLTDLRLFRADHVVAEDAFPGRVALTESELVAQEGALPEWAEAYVDVDTFDGGAYVAALQAGATLRGYDAAHATGHVAVSYINSVVTALREDGDETWSTIDDTTGLERGLAFVTLGKASPYSSIGSRYLAAKHPWLAYARSRWLATGGASEDMMGQAQEDWFLDTIEGSDAVWKVWGSEFSVVNRTIDTRGFSVPDAFRKEFLLSVEDWDGAPNKRDELLARLADVGNVVVLSGDIHAFFASTPWVTDDPDARIVEFVGGALSSNSYETLLVRTAAADPALRDAGATALALLVEDLLLGDDPGSNPQLAHARIDDNGFAVVEVGADTFDVTFHAIESKKNNASIPDAELDAAFAATRFRVQEGAADLYRDDNGTWRRWDPGTFGWV
jgi:alkaline phosphatase D